MTDTDRTSDGWVSSHEVNAGAPRIETVDDRLRKLEERLAAMNTSDQLESKVAERVMTRVMAELPNGMAAGDMIGVPGLIAATGYPAVPGMDGGFWSRFSFLREFRLISRMYIDPRYRLSRVTQLAAPLLVGFMVLNYFVFSFWSVPVLAPIFERVILIVLTLVLYKVLAWEAHRYEAVLRYLATYGR